MRDSRVISDPKSKRIWTGELVSILIIGHKHKLIVTCNVFFVRHSFYAINRRLIFGSISQSGSNQIMHAVKVVSFVDDAYSKGSARAPFSPESCNIYHFLPYKYQHYIGTIVFRDKSDHRKADYKAISKRFFELCFD